jgi:hypothetical protein
MYASVSVDGFIANAGRDLDHRWVRQQIVDRLGDEGERRRELPDGGSAIFDPR